MEERVLLPADLVPENCHKGRRRGGAPLTMGLINNGLNYVYLNAEQLLFKNIITRTLNLTSILPN